MDRPNLGQAVIIKAEMAKIKERDRGLNNSRSTKTRWERCELAKAPEGVYIGWRTICDCDFDASGYRDDYDESTRNFNHRVIWLIVIDEHMNPLYVLPEDVMITLPEEDEEDYENGYMQGDWLR